MVSTKQNEVAVKQPFRLEEIWRIRTRLEIEDLDISMAITLKVITHSTLHLIIFNTLIHLTKYD